MSRVPFNKPPLSLSDQVDLLQNRGMQIPDKGSAEATLLQLNYYRFSGYALHFEIFQNRTRTHQFKPGTCFEQVVKLYNFDTRLRALLFRYIEPIEIAFRSAICFELSIRTNDPHWYLKSNHYKGRFDLNRLQQDCKRECDRSDEIFIKSYRAKHSSPTLPPAWMLGELLSIGSWSMMFQHLADPVAQKAVAQRFATKPYFLASWIHSLSVLRNLCAHHCRIWNRNFTIRPSLPNSLSALVTANTKLAAQLIILTELLRPLKKCTDFQQDWDALLAEFPDVPQDKMGLLPKPSGMTS